jgi:fluoroquinolone transport system permease protein
MSKVATLFEKDARAIARDRFLLFMLFYGVLIALMLRLAIPWIEVRHLSLYIAPVAPMMGSLLAGHVLGFALIEERETRTWLLLRVVPLPQRVLALYLVGGTALLALVSGALCAAVYGEPVLRPALYFPLLCANALTAPVFMLFLGSFASNKIEGLAIGKIASGITAAPLALFFLTPPWQWLVAWSPWSWLYVGMLRAHTTDAQAAQLLIHWPPVPDWSTWAVPALLSIGLSALFARRYLRLAQ